MAWQTANRAFPPFQWRSPSRLRVGAPSRGVGGPGGERPPPPAGEDACATASLETLYGVGSLAGVRGSKWARMPPVSVETWNPFCARMRAAK
jgi:hypothetical protein